MSSGASGSDEKISGSKVEPLRSEVKDNTSLDQTSRGAAGSDRNIDQTRIDPLGSKGQYQHTAPHADSQGSVGRDDTIAGSKITPLEREQGSHTPQLKNPGLNDELVDSARSNPAGGVGEQQM
ncbi:MAG: hypothetical protein MMC23_006186 [Stictis urceolatum]|nr:hypothetical protein [Stictis urceolata]